MGATWARGRGRAEVLRKRGSLRRPPRCRVARSRARRRADRCTSRRLLEIHGTRDVDRRRGGQPRRRVLKVHRRGACLRSSVILHSERILRRTQARTHARRGTASFVISIELLCTSRGSLGGRRGCRGRRASDQGAMQGTQALTQRGESHVGLFRARISEQHSLQATCDGWQAFQQGTRCTGTGLLEMLLDSKHHAGALVIRDA
mmetsp:Transcript_12551/g.40105  ORF Transcript_12551/g.40105 Transcript_12551/m.40105 type:complete len:204 (+) Transcript_12551:286-897(+)